METTRLERAVRSLVRPVALIVTLALLLGHTAYDLGRLLRLAIDDRSQQLAALHCRLLGLAAPAPVAPPVKAATSITPLPAARFVPEPRPVAMACAPASPPAAVAAPPHDGLTVAQLRTLARSRGHRGAKVRDARRADLLLMLG